MSIVARSLKSISRTQVKTTEPGNESVHEIRRLFRDADGVGESFVYIANQYFSAQAISEALVRRITDRSRSKLEIILVVAKETNTFVEQAAIGIAQAKIIRHLKQLAAQTGHAYGVYYPASPGEDGMELARTQGLVTYLDQISNDPHSRLRRHPLLSDVAASESWIETIFPGGLPPDPEGPVSGEDSYEPIPAGRETLFPKGINWLSNFLSRAIE